MPYQIRKLPNSNKYTVRNTETGHVFAKRTTRDKAESLVRLLRAIGNNKHFVPYSNQTYGYEGHRPKRKSSKRTRRVSSTRRRSSSNKRR